MPPWSVPEALDAWYLVAGADEVSPGRVLPFAVAGVRGVLGRAADGTVFALRAVCPHMGADLRAGHVEGDRVVCPLHGFGFGADGRCDRAGVAPAETVPVALRCGAVFVHPGTPRAPPPAPERWSDLRFLPARGERVPVPWHTIVVNAFDLHHLRAVHGRALDADPVFDQPSPERLRVRYATRVVGDGVADRAMRALSGGRIDLHLTCVGGPVLIVEADLGRTRTAAVVGLVPDGDATWLRLSVGVPGSWDWRLRARVGRWLYTTFLRRDLPVLSGVRLEPRSALPEDAPVQRLVAFLESRPTR